MADVELNKENLQVFMENCNELNRTFHENLKLMDDNREWITEKLTEFFIEKVGIEPKSVDCADRCTSISINTGLNSLDNVDTSIFKELGLACDFVASWNGEVILKLHFPEGENL